MGFVIGLAFQLTCLSLLVLLGWECFRLIKEIGWNLIPILLAVSVLIRRLVTLLWINCKYFKDKTSTLDRIYNPQIYPWKRVSLNDRLSIVLLKMVPDMVEYTDFKSRPLPFNIWEGEKTFSYLRKTFLWNCLVFVSMYYWYKVGVENTWDVVLFVWSFVVGVGAILARYSKFNQSFRYYYERRFRLLSMSSSELIEKVSLRLVRRTFYFRRKRVLFCIIISLVGIIISVINMIIIKG